MGKVKIRTTIAAGCMVLLVFCTAHSALAQNAAATYARMAPFEQYLMADRDAEIALARSAAPASISRDATILVLGHKGYETAIRGDNGFVCLVGRAWGGAFDWGEFWNPKVRAPECLNPEAARTMVPIDVLRAQMVMSGRSKAEIVSALEAAFENNRIPELPGGAMSYMMSKSAYLTDQGAHDLPHVMFYTRLKDGKDWGAGAAGAPVLSSPYWFFSQKDKLHAKDLPPMLVFLVAVPAWSDGTHSDQHRSSTRGPNSAR